MKCIGTAVHPLPQGGEGKSRKARKSQQKCRNSRGRGLPRPGRPKAALHSNWDTTLEAAGLPKGMGSMYTELNQGNNMEISAQWGEI